jgi:hypothetical protein
MKWLKRIALALILLILGAVIFLYTRFQDRFPDYTVDLDVKNSPTAPLKAGFAALKITPEIPDTWTDANHDAQFNEKDGDAWKDGNGNGKFDPVWMAGFQNRRPAAGIHDDLWARAVVLDDGTTRLAIIALDAIGFGNDDVIRVRELIPETAGVDYAIVCSTHTHEAPDLLGLWGSSEFKSGTDPRYIRYVQVQAAKAVEEAVKNMRRAKLRFAQDLTGAKEIVMDTRKPDVLDEGLRLMQAVDAETNATLGTLVQWANHPETTWNENLLISSDFPHYIREAIEKGIPTGDSLAVPGLGGICVYFNGAIGGLMSTVPDFGVKDPFLDTVFVEPSFEKARAQGQRVALLALRQLRTDSLVFPLETGPIRLRATSFELPLDNRLYRLAAALGVLDRGLTSWFNLRTEVAAWRLGPATFLHQPGEIYPEIINGGIEKPDGQDFALDPQEIPPVRDMMTGTYKFTIGLSNDEIGYIIPKSQWDEDPPFTYGLHEAPYGEINSLGPQTGPLVYKMMKKILEEVGKDAK